MGHRAGHARATSRAATPPPLGARRSAMGERPTGPGSGESGSRRAGGGGGGVHLPYVRGGIVFCRTRSILVGCGGREPEDMKEESRRAFQSFRMSSSGETNGTP